MQKLKEDEIFLNTSRFFFAFQLYAAAPAKVLSDSVRRQLD
jgi:hypothetical protein